MSITIKDVAKLAGVGTTTVSRVANGASSVSDETRTKVLAAISRLRYSPCTQAIELRRANGANSPQSLIHSASLVGKRADRRSNRLRALESECDQVRRAIARLSNDLEKLKSELENFSNGEVANQHPAV